MIVKLPYEREWETNFAHRITDVGSVMRRVLNSDGVQRAEELSCSRMQQVLAEVVGRLSGGGPLRLSQDCQAADQFAPGSVLRPGQVVHR